ncbi:MAG: InlB B-repeat-containing protein [Spirochaetia bacterium]|nr:InlB B-repeat-containing protein [Spirochaetia bacterium]
MFSIILLVILTLNGCDLFQEEELLYSVTYVELDPEFGTAPVDRNRYETGANIIVKAYDDQNPGEENFFIGWNTKPDFTGNCYLPGDVIPEVEEHISLYAQWEKLYQIEYVTDGIDDVLLPYLPADSSWYRTGEYFRIRRINHAAGESADIITGWSLTPEFAADTDSGKNIDLTDTTIDFLSTVYKPGDKVLITSEIAAIETADGALSGTIRLYPRFTQYYTITYHSDTAETDITEGEGIEAPEDLRYYSAEMDVTIRNIEIVLDYDRLRMLCWNTEPDGTGMSLHPGDSISMSSLIAYIQEGTALHLYPIWEETYSIIYYADDSIELPAGEDDPSLIRNYLPGQTAYIMDMNHPHSDRYILKSWNTQPDGSGTSTAPGDSFTITAEGIDLSDDETLKELRLYAQYEQLYTITYHASYSDAGIAPADINFYKCGSEVRLKSNIGDLSRTGYLFNGWNTSTNGTGIHYKPGTIITIADADISLYPQWSEIYRVHYHDTEVTTGELPSDEGKYIYGDAYTVLNRWPQQFEDNKLFIGWSTATGSSLPTHLPGDSIRISSDSPKDIHLYAVWKNAYRIIYDANGADEGVCPSHSRLFLPGTAVSISSASESLMKGGQSFIIWNTQADGSGTSYEAGDEVTIGSSSITLYALYDILVFGSAGGYVFFDKGYYSNGWRYLEAAPLDWTDFTDDPGSSCWDYDEILYNSYWETFYYTEPNYIISGTMSRPGSGTGNTNIIVQNQHARGRDNTAAQICDELVTEDEMGELFDDWFLPSADEMLLFTEYAESYSGYRLSYYYRYWTSTEISKNNAYCVGNSPDGPALYEEMKDSIQSIVPIRMF